MSFFNAPYLATLRERDLSLGSVVLSFFNAPYLATLRERDLSLGSVVPEFPLIFGWQKINSISLSMSREIGRKDSGDFSLLENDTSCK
ncbi:hypothetical protein LEP1GSC086_2147 [Leptospira weilii str. LNT 1234]|nr:hypothetical protein LEP1GSC086_2147 [Leptospira weilii str. LNT 1234]